jgi:F-type H+-transporting ATPase subunit b
VLIDWFTIAAQILNFLVLVFLLHRFLYGPIVKMMDEREEHIFARLREAEQREEIAEMEARQYRQERAELDEQRRKVLVQAEQDAAARRKELIHQARQEADELKRHWQVAIQQAQERFLSDLRQGVTRQIFAVAHRALTDLADIDLEQQMVKVFLQRLREMSEEDRREIQPANDDGASMVVYSAFDLAPTDRQSIQNALQQITGNSIAVEFEARPRMISGLELRSSSRRVAWNLAHYLKSLEVEISRMMDLEMREAHESESDAAGTVAVATLPGSR